MNSNFIIYYFRMNKKSVTDTIFLQRVANLKNKILHKGAKVLRYLSLINYSVINFVFNYDIILKRS